MALPARNHRISLKDAAVITKRHQAADPKSVKGGAFHKDQVLELLNQPGCVGLRVYYGRDTTGAPNLVLTGIDSADSDLTGGTILEIFYPCPPFCGGGNPLNS